MTQDTRAQGDRSRSIGIPGRCPAGAIHHFSSLARPAAAASHSTFRHDTPVFACRAPPRAPWQLPDPPPYPIANKCNRSYSDRSGRSLHPPHGIRHFSTLVSNSVESPIPAAAFAPCSHLTWGVSSRWERGCSRLALFRKNVFRTPSTTPSVVPLRMRSDDSGECPSPAAGRVSNGQGKHLDLARMFHLRSQRGAMRGPQHQAKPQGALAGAARRRTWPLRRGRGVPPGPSATK